MKERESGEEQFGQLVVTLGYASPIEVSEAIRLQQTLIKKGKWKPLGQILVERGVLTVEKARQVLLRQGKTLLVCRSCKSKFNLADPSSGELFKCRVCNGIVDVVGSPDELEEEEEEGVEDPLIGATLAGCKIHELLWEDAISRSYKAWQVGPQRDVVLRILKERCAHDKELIKRFLKEAAAAAKVHHPAICPIYDVGQAEGYFYICHGYFEGPTLKERVESEGRLPIKLAASVALHLINGMITAHKQKVIHRDIRPENVVFPGGKNRPVLMGLGIYKRVAEKTEGTEVGVLLGSPEFMAPEQIKDYSSADERSDIFSIGALLFYMIVGSSPFQAENLVEALAKNLEGKRPNLADITDNVPKEICYLVDKMLARFPDKRFANLQQVKTALESLDVSKLPARKAEIHAYSPSVTEGELRLADEEPEKETYDHIPPDLELAPPSEKEVPELKLAEPETPRQPKEEPADILSQKEREEILSETFKKEPTAPAAHPHEEPKEQPSWKKMLKEKAPFIALGIVALIIVVVLIMKLGGEAEPGPQTPRAKERLAQEDYKYLLKFAKEQEKKGNYQAIISLAIRLYNKHINTLLADNFLEVAERYRRMLADKKVMEEWSRIKEWVKKHKGQKRHLEEARRRVEKFIRAHADHPLANEARKLLEELQAEEHLIAARSEVEDGWRQVKELCSKGQYVTAYKMVGVQELRLQQRYRRLAARFAGEFSRMREHVVQEARRFFEEAKKRAFGWEARGKVDKALEELNPFVAWLAWEKRGEKESLKPLLLLAHEAKKTQDAIKARFKRGMMRARIVYNALIHQASTLAAQERFDEARTLLQRASSLAKEARLPRDIAASMLKWLGFAKRFSTAHIDYLKNRVGKSIEVKTKSNIPYQGTLESFDGQKLGIKVQTGRVVYVPLEKVQEKFLKEFARREMGEQDGRVGEAAAAYFRGEGDASLLEGVIGDAAQSLRQAFRERDAWKRTTRIIWLFSGTSPYRLRRERGKVSIFKVDDEFGNALRLTEGALAFTETIPTEYILRFQFCCRGGTAPLKVTLPMGADQSVAVVVPAGGNSLSFEGGEAKSQNFSIRLGEWYETEIRVLGTSVTVFVDGQKVLETTSVSPKTTESARLRFRTDKEADWLLRQIYFVELK